MDKTEATNVSTTPTEPALSGRTVVVTGSTSGIGAAAARALAGVGAHVLVSGRDTARGEAIVEAIRGAGGDGDFLAVDLGGSYEEIRAFATEATSLLGQIDVLVNNAGVYPSPPTVDLGDEELDAMLAINVRAPYVLVAAIAPQMAERGSGVVINVGSWMAQVGSPIGAMYTATKAAEEQLARSWAAEFGPLGVRVNSIAPGVTLTPGNEEHRAVLDQIAATTPAGKVVQADDIADGVVFLASDAARMIHGITLYVDGGIANTRVK